MVEVEGVFSTNFFLSIFEVCIFKVLTFEKYRDGHDMYVSLFSHPECSEDLVLLENMRMLGMMNVTQFNAQRDLLMVSDDDEYDDYCEYGFDSYEDYMYDSYEDAFMGDY